MNENTNTENTAAQAEEPKKGPIKKVTKDMIISDLAMEDAGIVDILMDAEAVEEHHAADAEQHLLLESVLPVTAVERVSDGAVKL